MSRLIKPPSWAWTPAALTPQWQEIARGLTFLVPFWEQDAGAVAVSQLRDVVNGHQVSSFNNGVPSWRIAEPGAAAGVDAVAGIRQIEYDTFPTFNTPGNAMSGFVVLNERGNPTDNGILALNGSVGQLWWHSSPNRMSVRVGNVSYNGVDNGWPLDSEWQAVGFSFINGGGIDRVTGWYNGAKILTATPTQDIASSSAPFVIGADGSSRTHRNVYALVAVWDRFLSDAEQEALAADWFGLIRPEYWSAAMAPTAVGPITGDAILQGVGTVTADGQTSATGAATLTGTGTLTADGTIGIPTGQAALTGTGILTADGTAIVPIVGEAILQGVGILTAQSLPPLSILSIRQLLAEGIRQSLHLAGRDDVAVYEYPPETVAIPAVVIMPDEPYWQPTNFGRSPLERIRVNLEIQMLTPRLEVSESFNDLERLGGIVLQGTLRVPVVQWTEMGQPEGVTVNDIETIMTRASVMAHV